MNKLLPAILALAAVAVVGCSDANSHASNAEASARAAMASAKEAASYAAATNTGDMNFTLYGINAETTEAYLALKKAAKSAYHSAGFYAGEAARAAEVARTSRIETIQAKAAADAAKHAAEAAKYAAEAREQHTVVAAMWGRVMTKRRGAISVGQGD